MLELVLVQISLSFDGKAVLSGCDLRLSKGERVALMGPSGCGKTSLLRVAMGLQRPDAGRVINRFSRTAAVFQEPRLLPWLSAEENVNLMLSDRKETQSAAREWLRRFELEDACGLYPAELSGGMQQRAALARALACSPTLLVLDEPFKAMDEKMRGRMIALTARTAGDAAVLLATHSRDEAEALGCRVLVYRNGRFAE